MPTFRKILAAVCLCMAMPAFLIADSDLSIGGYYKSFFTALRYPEIKNATLYTLSQRPAIGLVNNRLRLHVTHKPASSISMQAAYDISPRVQDPSLFESSPFVTNADTNGYRFDDLSRRLYPAPDETAGSFGIFQNLDRAFVDLKPPFADIIIGRQAIAWGSARVINPTDIIAPFTFEDLDTEDRLGVDAVRIRVPIGIMGEFDAGYVFGKDFKFKRSAFFTRTKFYALKTDLTLMAIGFRDNLLVGVDVARSIGGAGFWFEAGYTFVNALVDYETGENYNYFRASTGLDYSFTGKTYGFVEYHFNGAGTEHPEDYLTNFSHPAYTKGNDYLLGKHYLAPGMTYQVTPLITFSGQALINITDPSLFITPQLDYNISENVYIAGGAFIGVGKSPEYSVVQGRFPMLHYRSEFGGYPNIYFTSFRIYF